MITNIYSSLQMYIHAIYILIFLLTNIIKFIETQPKSTLSQNTDVMQ